jgi:NAD(P)-dependent dehydrogenase (short-subunit alcohol dehydrogenase family)
VSATGGEAAPAVGLSNVFGVVACVQAVAPHFREGKAGVLINVSSIGGLIMATIPVQWGALRSH